ncbi:hypothetical protein M407DRAFT_31044 [Tulasnella calospora MUT 4182]|uniref:F-box domain-containing protein n=1 Tax=Tulasnella calospora MUT 4182 TaxID=1051891 RepID=A0A0C3KCU8_9AGAM|nr:hypothetical protein M407DRAFT_31044 [Tulasnella calospora MUT 4182]
MLDEDRRPAGRPSVPPVLSISEILIYIFRELDNASRAAAARVCQTWVEAALDVLWEDLESPLPIMALLGPIRDYYTRGWDWETGSPDGDWPRFASYTKRVRSFSYDGRLYSRGGYTEYSIASNVPAKLLSYVATNHGAYLLPQNQRLRWRAFSEKSLQEIPSFLSPNIKGVDVEIKEQTSSAIYQLLRTLQEVLPHDMVSLRFVPHNTMGDELEAEMTRAINFRSNLRVLRLPVFPMNTSMFIPNLRVLEAESDSAWNSDPGAILLHLSEKCPLIEDLRILFPGDSVLTAESVRPLFRCSNLRSLDLEYTGAVDIQDQHIREMGGAWRDLEALHISSRRAYDGPLGRPSGIPIASLVTFAQAFSPKLRKLAIHINSSDAPLPPNPPVCFPNLEFFSVGTSRLGYSETEYRRIAWFLGSVLPLRIHSVNSDVLSFNRYRSVFKFKPHEDGRFRWSASPVWDMVSGMLYDYRKTSSNDA